jgi:hypothetical protein
VAGFMTICFERRSSTRRVLDRVNSPERGAEAHWATRSKNQTGDPASGPDRPLDFPKNTGKFLMGLCSHEEILDHYPKNKLFFSIYL